MPTRIFKNYLQTLFAEHAHLECKFAVELINGFHKTLYFSFNVFIKVFEKKTR